MSYTTIADNQRVYNLFGEAKALKYAVIHKAISYEKAKIKAEAFLQEVNEAGEKIAKKYGRRYRKIGFTNL